MSNFLKIADADITWLVRIVFEGEGYGQWNEEKQCFALNHDEGLTTEESVTPIVEFYDTRREGSPFGGYFVSRYFVSMLLRRNATGGLNLQGDVPEWSISARTMEIVRSWLAQFGQGDRQMSSNDPHVHCSIAVVANDDGSGNPGIKFQSFFVPETLYNWGQHLKLARDMARDAGMEGEMVEFCNEELPALAHAGRALENSSPTVSEGLNQKETSIVLAALRWFQSCKNGEHDMSEVADIFDPDDVSMNDIDDLCERINFGS